MLFHASRLGDTGFIATVVAVAGAFLIVAFMVFVGVAARSALRSLLPNKEFSSWREHVRLNFHQQYDDEFGPTQTASEASLLTTFSLASWPADADDFLEGQLPQWQEKLPPFFET